MKNTINKKSVSTPPKEVTMNVTQAAANIGTLLGGVASLVAIVTAFYEFRRYRKQRRSEAAIRAYSSVQSCVDYIDEIANRLTLYEIKEYYPFHLPEIRIITEKKYEERPAQLIINRIYECKKDLYESVAILGGVERKELLRFLEKMQKAASTLIDDIYAHPHKDTTEQMHRHIEKVQTTIKEISENIYALLTPIIEGR